MNAKDFMTTNVITCSQDKTVKEAAEIMLEHSFSTLPIVDETGVLVGIITESDFVSKEAKIPHALASIKQLFGQDYYFKDIESIYLETRDKKISNVMSKKLITVDTDTNLTSIVNLMMSKHLKRLPVLDNGKLVGIITRKDLMRAYVNVN
jgi:CBS domain-containing protein